jgi:hypothetical protein
MEPQNRYAEGTPVLAQGRKATVIRDYGSGHTRTVEVKLSDGCWVGRTFAVSGFSVKRDPNPERELPSEVPQTTTTTTMSSEKEQILQYTQVDGTILYGTYVATNKDGDMLLKTTGGDIVVTPASAVEEVRPWTFKAVDVQNGNVYEFVHKPDVLRVNDIIMPNGATGLLRVVKTNTKSRTASQYFKGRRVSTEPVEATAAADA